VNFTKDDVISPNVSSDTARTDTFIQALLGIGWIRLAPSTESVRNEVSEEKTT